MTTVECILGFPEIYEMTQDEVIPREGRNTVKPVWKRAVLLLAPGFGCVRYKYKWRFLLIKGNVIKNPQLFLGALLHVDQSYDQNALNT